MAVYGQEKTLYWDESMPYGKGNDYYNMKTLTGKYIMEDKDKINVVCCGLGGYMGFMSGLE
ncbi:MAG: hypothetical protein DRP57_09075 [Spirochaetes bacterium]|nr:MAG: hypothetical protein DRP57_09075 [Spirochaetota bacterium]